MKNGPFNQDGPPATVETMLKPPAQQRSNNSSASRKWRADLYLFGTLLRMFVCVTLCMSLLQKSTHEWLHSVGEDLSRLIGLQNKRDIKHHLQPVVERHPDFRWADFLPAAPQQKDP